MSAEKEDQQMPSPVSSEQSEQGVITSRENAESTEFGASKSMQDEENSSPDHSDSNAQDVAAPQVTEDPLTIPIDQAAGPDQSSTELANIEKNTNILHHPNINLESTQTWSSYLTGIIAGSSLAETITPITKMTKDKFVEILGHEDGMSELVTNVLDLIPVNMVNGTDTNEVLGQAVIDRKQYKGILEYLNHDYFSLHQILKSKQKQQLVHMMLQILHNTLRSVPGARAVMYEGIRTVQKFINTEDKSICHISMAAEMILSYLMTEKEYENNPTDDSSIKFITEGLRDTIKSSDHHTFGYSAAEMVDAINRIAVSDFNTEKILKNGGLECYMQLIGQDRSPQEQLLAVKGLWMLAFKCRNKIMEVPKYVEAIKSLRDTTTDPLVRKEVDGFLWTLEGKDKEIRQDTPNDDHDNIPHVFISYNWGSQNMVLKIKERLANARYKIWIDVQNMKGMMLQAMAEAVEKASVVLICFSEKYKESPNCRAEGAYTYDRHKEIIPLKMQDHYKADGWLGILVANQIYIDFSSDDKFENSMKDLLKHLETSVKQSDDRVVGPPVKPPDAVSGAASWDVSQVADWLSRTDIERNDWFADVDGPVLVQLREMYQKAPEYFFKMLTKELNWSLKSVLKFTKVLNDLS